jgi:hypothetical protein
MCGIPNRYSVSKGWDFENGKYSTEHKYFRPAPGRADFGTKEEALELFSLQWYPQK